MNQPSKPNDTPETWRPSMGNMIYWKNKPLHEYSKDELMQIVYELVHLHPTTSSDKGEAIKDDKTTFSYFPGGRFFADCECGHIHDRSVRCEDMRWIETTDEEKEFARSLGAEVEETLLNGTSSPSPTSPDVQITPSDTSDEREIEPLVDLLVEDYGDTLKQLSVPNLNNELFDVAQSIYSLGWQAGQARQGNDRRVARTIAKEMDVAQDDLQRLLQQAKTKSQIEVAITAPQFDQDIFRLHIKRGDTATELEITERQYNHLLAFTIQLSKEVN